MKILVVDDDSTVLKSCQRVLEPEGLEVYRVPKPFTPAELLDAIHKATEKQESHD